MKRDFVVLGDTVNSSIVSFDTGEVIVIDSSVTEEQGRQLKEEAEKTGPIAYLINTHEHGDHLAGNKFFACPKISSALARESILRIADVDPATIPTMTFTDRMTLHLGEPVELVCMGGHCPGVAVVYLPERKLLFTGDLVFNGRMPYMGVADFSVWIAALKELESWDVDQVVPGHGPVGGKEVLTQQRLWLESFVTQVKEWKTQGLSAEQTFAEALAKYAPPERWHTMITKAIELASI